MVPETYNFQTTVSGDTYPQTDFTFTDSNNDPIDLTNGTVTIVFRKFSVCEEPTIQIQDGPNGVVRMPAFTLDWDHGTWNYQLRISIPGGSISTYISGNLVVLEAVECLSP